MVATAQLYSVSCLLVHRVGLKSSTSHRNHPIASFSCSLKPRAAAAAGHWNMVIVDADWLTWFCSKMQVAQWWSAVIFFRWEKPGCCVEPVISTPAQGNWIKCFNLVGCLWGSWCRLHSVGAEIRFTARPVVAVSSVLVVNLISDILTINTVSTYLVSSCCRL